MSTLSTRAIAVSAENLISFRISSLSQPIPQSRTLSAMQIPTLRFASALDMIQLQCADVNGIIFSIPTAWTHTMRRYSSAIVREYFQPYFVRSLKAIKSFLFCMFLAKGVFSDFITAQRAKTACLAFIITISHSCLPIRRLRERYRAFPRLTQVISLRYFEF